MQYQSTPEYGTGRKQQENHSDSFDYKIVFTAYSLGRVYVTTKHRLEQLDSRTWQGATMALGFVENIGWKTACAHSWMS